MTNHAVPPTVPMAQPPVLNTKRTLSYTSIGLVIASSILIIVTFWLTYRGFWAVYDGGKGSISAAIQAIGSEGAKVPVSIIFGIANLVAFILAIVAIVKERPRLYGIIALVVAIVLPSVAFYVASTFVPSAGLIFKGL